MEDEFQNTMEHPLQKGFRRCFCCGKPSVNPFFLLIFIFCTKAVPAQIGSMRGPF